MAFKEPKKRKLDQPQSVQPQDTNLASTNLGSSASFLTQENSSSTSTTDVDQFLVPDSLDSQHIQDLAFLPIRHPIMNKYYNALKDTFWVPAEVDLKQERNDWEKNMTPNEKRLTENILGFFSQLDGLVIENISQNFQEDTSFLKDVRSVYAAINFNETIHNEMYSIIIETIFVDPVKKAQVLNSIVHNPIVGKIAKWGQKYMNRSLPLLHRIAAFAFLEGVLFSGAFCAIYWLKRRGKLPGVCKANEWIARDEGLHFSFAMDLFHLLVSEYKYDKPSFDTIRAIVEEGMSLAIEFVQDSLQIALVEINSKDMIQYVSCTADYMLTTLGYPKIYNVTNPFDWMLVIGVPNQTNFFESAVSEYSRKRTEDIITGEFLDPF